MSQVSQEVFQTMFNHLTASYSADEARDILVQKYPESADEIAQMVPTEFRTTIVEMGKVAHVIEPGADLKAAVKQKTAKVKAVATDESKAPSKVDRARQLYADATDKSRAAVIAVFMAELGMSKAAASTYYYNVKG